MTAFAFLRNCNTVWNVPKPVTTRLCRSCGETKPLGDFYLKGEVDPRGEPRRFHRCKVCMVEKQIVRNRRG